MERIARFGRLKADALAEYRRLHHEMSAELLHAHREAGFRNFSIYLRGVELFSYVECDDWELSLQKIAANPVTQAWSKRIMPLLDDPLEWEILEEIWRLD